MYAVENKTVQSKLCSATPDTRFVQFKFSVLILECQSEYRFSEISCLFANFVKCPIFVILFFYLYLVLPLHMVFDIELEKQKIRDSICSHQLLRNGHVSRDIGSVQDPFSKITNAINWQLMIFPHHNVAN